MDFQDDYGIGALEDAGFASQTNLVLFGQNTADTITRLINHNTFYPNYINSYNHIVFLGEDTSNVVDLNLNSSGNNFTDTQDTGSAREFNFKFALGDNIPADNLQQPASSYIFTANRTCIGSICSYFPNFFTFPQINLDVFLNPTNISLYNWRIISIENYTNFNSPVSFNFPVPNPTVLSYNLSPTSTGPFLSQVVPTPPEATPSISSTSYKLVNPISDLGLQTIIFDQLINSLKPIGSDYIEDGYYLFKLTLRSIDANGVNATNPTKSQNFYIRIV